MSHTTAMVPTILFVLSFACVSVSAWHPAPSIDACVDKTPCGSDANYYYCESPVGKWWSHKACCQLTPWSTESCKQQCYTTAAPSPPPPSPKHRKWSPPSPKKWSKSKWVSSPPPSPSPPSPCPPSPSPPSPTPVWEPVPETAPTWSYEGAVYPLCKPSNHCPVGGKFYNCLSGQAIDGCSKEPFGPIDCGKQCYSDKTTSYWKP